MLRGQSVNPRARFLTVLALWQWMAVVLGYLVAHGFLKRFEGSFIQCYRQNEPLLTQLSFFVRDFGF